MNSKREWEFGLYMGKLLFFREMEDGIHGLRAGIRGENMNSRLKISMPIQDDHFVRVTFERCGN